MPARRPIVFLGSSLSLEAARAVLDADFRAPAAQGDVLAAAMEGPIAIGLVDGTFDRVPAVWHKEILWALCEGIAVYGAASMGALRAAELDRFGMRGVGQVYQAYRDGTLEDDDEVAVAHGGADEDWRALSDAMIDVRECLTRARRAGIIAEGTAADLAVRVKETFYPLRRLDAVLDTGRADHRALRSWLRANPISVKRQDATELLEVMRADIECHATDAPPTFAFSRTAFFDAAHGAVLAARAARVGRDQPGMIDRSEQDPLGQLLDEVRLDPLRFSAVLHEATAAALALGEAERLDEEGGPWGHRSMVERFRRARVSSSRQTWSAGSPSAAWVPTTWMRWAVGGRHSRPPGDVTPCRSIANSCCRSGCPGFSSPFDAGQPRRRRVRPLVPSSGKTRCCAGTSTVSVFAPSPVAGLGPRARVGCRRGFSTSAASRVGLRRRRGAEPAEELNDSDHKFTVEALSWGVPAAEPARDLSQRGSRRAPRLAPRWRTGGSTRRGT